MPKNKDENGNFDRDFVKKEYTKKFFSKYLKGIIPCMFLQCRKYPSDKLLIYFHANGEDIGRCYELCNTIREDLGVNVISVEYPGYSFYRGNPSEKQILEDAETVLNFVHNVLEVPYNNIMIMGRSLGGGAATYLASRYRVRLLILISAFGSLKEVVKDNFGKFGSMFVKEGFDNANRIKEVKSHTLIIHGAKDDVVKVHQAEI